MNGRKMLVLTAALAAGLGSLPAIQAANQGAEITKEPFGKTTSGEEIFSAYRESACTVTGLARTQAVKAR